MKNIVRSAFINALVTAGYIVLVAIFLFYGTKSFGPTETVFIPIVMLTLFVFSAAFTSFMVFGRPAMWFINGHKKEALSLFIYTLAYLFAFLLIGFALLFISK